MSLMIWTVFFIDENPSYFLCYAMDPSAAWAELVII